LESKNDAGLDKISKRELREVLTKGWMTHDAMWLMHSIEELGIETANKLNISAVKSLSCFTAGYLNIWHISGICILD